MAHAPGCDPSVYFDSIDDVPVKPGFEWRAYGEVRLGDLDQFDRPVTAILPNKSGTRVRIACGASSPEADDATLPVEKMAAHKVTDWGMYRVRTTD